MQTSVNINCCCCCCNIFYRKNSLRCTVGCPSNAKSCKVHCDHNYKLAFDVKWSPQNFIAIEIDLTVAHDTSCFVSEHPEIAICIFGLLNNPIDDIQFQIPMI